MFTMGTRCAIGRGERGAVDVDNHDAILIERNRNQGSTSWSVTLVSKGVALKRNGVNGYAAYEGGIAWINESDMKLVDRKISTNIRFHDWCEEISEYRCGDCGYWHGKMEDVTDYDENPCPRCGNTEEGYDKYLDSLEV